jgi:predicted naringenin-chalcone synthase
VHATKAGAEADKEHFDGHLPDNCSGGHFRVLLRAGLHLSREELGYSWDVLRDLYMSSPTALFALAQAVAADARGPHLLAAFGPGFSAYFLAVDL